MAKNCQSDTPVVFRLSFSASRKNLQFLTDDLIVVSPVELEVAPVFTNVLELHIGVTSDDTSVLALMPTNFEIARTEVTKNSTLQHT